jgi:hypothetical protein
MPFEERRKICLNYMVTGIETISETASSPFRFIYVSNANSERDQTKKPWILGDYALMWVSSHFFLSSHSSRFKSVSSITTLTTEFALTGKSQVAYP